MKATLNIRPETPKDQKNIHHLHQEAFGQPNEAKLVDALRNAKTITLSIVATLQETLVGHILFSPVTIEENSINHRAIGLGPIAVLPAYQSQGIGKKLIEHSLQTLETMRETAVIVLGHPTYYPRFGFLPASHFGLRWEKPIPDEVFMAKELVPDSLSFKTGIVRYRSEFLEFS